MSRLNPSVIFKKMFILAFLKGTAPYKMQPLLFLVSPRTSLVATKTIKKAAQKQMLHAILQHVLPVYRFVLALSASINNNNKINKLIHFTNFFVDVPSLLVSRTVNSE